MAAQEHTSVCRVAVYLESAFQHEFAFPHGRFADQLTRTRRCLAQSPVDDQTEMVASVQIGCERSGSVLRTIAKGRLYY